MRYLTTLTIAGSDSSGGAGIQADIKTMSALGCYAASVITSVTAQNTCGVRCIHDVPPEVVASQIVAVMDDIQPKAVKIGMMNATEIIHAVADELEGKDGIELVVDPVMVATSGDRLMKKDALSVFCLRLLPMATLLTPNLPEAELLADMTIHDERDIIEAGKRILQQGCKAVLIKGGHLIGDEKNDTLITTNGNSLVSQVFSARSQQTKNTHGTGCTLSAAITAFLAMGKSLEEAVGCAKNYVTSAIEAGCRIEIGRGCGPVNHFFQPKKLLILP